MNWFKTSSIRTRIWPRRMRRLSSESHCRPSLGILSSLAQAVSNLLNNARKFVAREKKPHIEIWTETRLDKVRLWIKDNGIGIGPMFQSRLFGLFERLHESDAYEGTGIGLAIVRKAVEKMGGTVGMKSDGINGSSFWIELPGPTQSKTASAS